MPFGWPAGHSAVAIVVNGQAYPAGTKQKTIQESDDDIWKQAAEASEWPNFRSSSIA